MYFILVTVTEINHLAIESIKWIVQNLAVPSKRYKVVGNICTYLPATHRTRQITECRNKEGFPYENNGSSVRTFIFPFLSYFIFTQAKNIYNFKKIKN